MKKSVDLNKDLPDSRYIKARTLVSAAKARYWPAFSKDTNIVGAAFGRREAHNEVTDEPAMVVYVVRKVAQRFLPLSRLLPRRIYLGGDYVEVDIVETGPLYPHSFTARERPATFGISIINANDQPSAGTLGALVIDNTDGSQCILSNNHVMARQNAAALGERIIQPGSYDGGSSPADDIASLKRFVPVNATGNTVDCAIAQINDGDVINQVHNNIFPVASSDHPAVGLLFAGGCNRTIMNPVDSVLFQLNISFPSGKGATTSADIGMNVEKVGRTTEYTTSTVKEIDATVVVAYEFGNATFDHQIATAWMSDPGDSGSVVYRGGAGGNEDHCGSCGSTSSASRILDTSLEREKDMAKFVRDQFLRHTRIGRWAIDLFYANEDRALERLNETNISQDDRLFAKKMYDKYRENAYSVFAQGEKSELTLTQHHIKDLEAAFSRAKPYLQKPEIHAGEQLLALIKTYGIGKNVRQILALLNDEKLENQVKEILSKVPSIKQGGQGTCCH